MSMPQETAAWFQADAEVRERRLQRDVGAQGDGRDDDDGRDGVGHDVAEHHPRVGGAECPGRLDVVVLFGGDDGAARDACDLRPAQQHDEADHGPDGGAGDDGQEDESAEDHRDAEEDVRDAGEHGVPSLAEEAGETAQHAAQQRDPEGREDTDGHRGPGAVDGAGVDVAALAVEAEGVAGLGALLGLGQVAVERVLVGDQRRPDRDDHQEQDDQRGDDEDRVAAQVPPGVGPEAARLAGRSGALGAAGRLLQCGALVHREVHAAARAGPRDRSAARRLVPRLLLRHSGSSGRVRRTGGRRSGSPPGRRGPGR